MEVEVEDTAVIGRDGAASARLGDKDSLDLLMTSCDRFADAALATPALAWLARPVKMEHDPSVALAVANLGGAVPRRRAAGLISNGTGGVRGSSATNTCSHAHRTDHPP